VDMIATMAGSVPLVVVKEDEESQLTAAEMAVEKLLARPNPQWTGTGLQYFVAASLAVTNRAFILRVRGAGNTPLELWPLEPDQVVVNYPMDGSGARSRMIESFTVQNGMRQDTYEVNQRTGDSDVIYIRKPALNAQADKSPAAIAAAPAEVFTRILQRSADILANASNITGLLSTESEMAKTAVQEIRQRIDQFKTGREKSGGTLVTANARWNLTRLSEDPAAALSVPIKDSIARDIAMTFGVPTQLVGIPGSDTFNNVQLARVGLVNDTVLPGYVNLYVAGLNQALMKNGAHIEVDLEGIPSMAAARGLLTDQAIKSTFLSINEQRELLGYGKYEGPGAEDADIPVKLMELQLKKEAVEAQGGIAGGVPGILAGEGT